MGVCQLVQNTGRKGEKTLTGNGECVATGKTHP